MGNVGDLFNKLYYIYKDKYNKEKDGLDTKNKKLFYYKKLRLTDNYHYESDKERKKKEKNNKLVKRNHLKDQQKRMWAILMNELIEKKQA